MKLLINTFLFLFIFSHSAVSQTNETGTPFNSYLPQDNPANQNFNLDKMIPGEKTTNADFYRLKTVVTDNFRYTYSYDNSKLATKLIEILTNEGNWEIYIRNVYTYDDNGNILRDLFQRWYDSVWVDGSRYIYTYNNDGKITLSLRETFINGNWVDGLRYSYTYNGNVVTIVHDRNPWGTWEIDLRITVTYNNSGQEISRLFEEWQNTFVNTYKWSYSYDVNGKLMVVFGEDWENNNWVNSTRILYTYNNNGQLLVITWENWGSPVQRYIYTYDVNANLESIIWELRAVPSAKIVYLCDNYGNTIHGEHFVWEDSIWVMRPGTTEIIYNKMENIEHLFACKWFDASYDILTDVNYTEAQVTEYALKNNYPNPFNPVTTISWQLPVNSHVTIKVYDLLGQEVRTLVNETMDSGYHSTEFNAGTLNSGVYFYRIEAEGIDGSKFSLTKKLMLMK